MTEYVLTREAIQDTIEELIDLPVHPHFPGYLCLIQESNRLSQLSGLGFDYFKFFNTYLKISDQNPPYFVPFNQAENPDWSALRFNENVSGTYAPSSLRETSPLRQVAKIEGSGHSTNWSLVDQHWEIAREALCRDQKVPVELLAAFLFRDYSFSAQNPNSETLVGAFCEEFYYGRASDAFQHLYDVGSYEFTAEDFTEWTGEGANDQATLGSPSQVRSAQKVRQLTIEDLGIPLSDQDEDISDQLLEEAGTIATNTVGNGPDRGAAVLTPEGNIYAAARIETPDQRQTSHALELAIKRALSDGNRRVTEATVLSTDGDVSVCGGCRELIGAFAVDDTVVHGVLDGEEVFTATVGEILPDEL